MIHFLEEHNGKPSHNPDGVTYDYSLDEAIAADERLHALCIYETHENVSPVVGADSSRQRVLLPHVYGHIICTKATQTKGLAELFPDRPDLGALVRVLTLRNETFEKTYIPLGGIIENVPNLRVLSASDHDHVTDDGQRVGDPGVLTLQWAEFAALARAAPNLEAIRDLRVGKEYIESPNPAAPPAAGKGKRMQAHGKELTVSVGPLTPFRSLRVLRFDAPVKLAFTGSTVPKDMFLALEELQLYSCHTSLLKLLILCEMPHLRILGMYGRALACRDAGDFLKKHGKNIEELNLKSFPSDDIFKTCEKVKKLRVEEKKPPPGYSTKGWASSTLESVFFVSELSQLKPSNRPWMPILLDLDAGKLPALESVYMRIRWPSGEFDTKKDFWVPLAEELLNKGIKLRDARHGLSWIPRVGLRSSLKW
uniref:Uncharacterized protein n=1 Tax=Schizophyllum commune (strain H4-8 / FGSC 9210) TaxID=578458 RepID=D8Q2Y6_SCHCM